MRCPVPRIGKQAKATAIITGTSKNTSAGATESPLRCDERGGAQDAEQVDNTAADNIANGDVSLATHRRHDGRGQFGEAGARGVLLGPAGTGQQLLDLIAGKLDIAVPGGRDSLARSSTNRVPGMSWPSQRPATAGMLWSSARCLTSVGTWCRTG
jgi:hypothetical protein